jgi:hypothetical protein
MDLSLFSSFPIRSGLLKSLQLAANVVNPYGRAFARLTADATEAE